MAKGFFLKNRDHLVSALTKARDFLRAKLTFVGSEKLDTQILASLKDLMIKADFGRCFSDKVMKELQRDSDKSSPKTPNALLKNAILQTVLQQNLQLSFSESIPRAVMVIGVNGHGKTTSCAKLGAFYQAMGYCPLFVAADTFRAAASEQLEVWSKKLNIDLVRGKRGSQPAAVVFDGIQTAVNQKKDICIIDSAGRLHNQPHLMVELQKMQRVCGKIMPGAPHEIFLVIEAPTGQNAFEQVKQFSTYLPVTGIILTKLDGSAQGGIALALQEECKIPVRFIGTGEKPEDFGKFEIENFIDALFDP